MKSIRVILYQLTKYARHIKQGLMLLLMNG